jgi:hypothetical protein
MVLAAQQAHQPGPWQVYDAVQPDGRLATLVSPGDGRSVQASELMTDAAERWASGTAAATWPRPVLPRPDNLREPEPEVEAQRKPTGHRGLPHQVRVAVGSNLVALVAAAVLAGMALGAGPVPRALLFTALGLACIAAGVFAPVLRTRSVKGSFRSPDAVAPPKRAAEYLAIVLLGLGCLGAWAALQGDVSVASLMGRWRGRDTASVLVRNTTHAPGETADGALSGEVQGLPFEALADTLAQIWTVRDSTLSRTRESLRVAHDERDTANARLSKFTDSLVSLTRANVTATRRITTLESQVVNLRTERDTARAQLGRLRASVAAQLRRGGG